MFQRYICFTLFVTPLKHHLSINLSEAFNERSRIKKRKKKTRFQRATFLQPTKIPNQLASKTEWLWELRNQSPSKVRTINKMKSITPASSSSIFPTRLASLPTSNKSMKMFQSFLFQVKRTVETPLLLSLVSLSLVCIQYNF